MTIVHLVQFRRPYADEPDRTGVFSTEDLAIAFAFKVLKDYAAENPPEPEEGAEDEDEDNERPPLDLSAFEAAGDWKGALDAVLEDAGSLTIDKLVMDEG